MTQTADIRKKYQDRIRGCMIGGAAGDALGYAIEFDTEAAIAHKFGPAGIQWYEIDKQSGKALISDDTQMSLFTANAMLFRESRGMTRGVAGTPSNYAQYAYLDWYQTQTSFPGQSEPHNSWLLKVPELWARRAPGNTCIQALSAIAKEKPVSNNSKGCGGVMRVAPVGLYNGDLDLVHLAKEGGEIAKITHQHPLGWLPAVMLVYLINRIVYHRKGESLLEIVDDATNHMVKHYHDNPHTMALNVLIETAIDLAQNNCSDIENIHRLGEGWVAEEALAIAVYCAIRYHNDFSACIRAAVNHRGDSDSTGAIAGNIIGAWLGYEAIDDNWKRDLELRSVILEMADDLCFGCPPLDWYPGSECHDPAWEKKYIYLDWSPDTEPDSAE